MEKQTAVSWLNAELERLTTRAGINMSWAMMDDLLKQAKELERQQIVEAYEQGQAKEAKEAFWTKGNDYYNQTFKQ